MSSVDILLALHLDASVIVRLLRRGDRREGCCNPPEGVWLGHREESFVVKIVYTLW